MQLVARHARGVVLTDAGLTLLVHAQQLLSSADRLHTTLSSFGQDLRGSIRLMANTVACNEFLPVPLGSFLAAPPRWTSC